MSNTTKSEANKARFMFNTGVTLKDRGFVLRIPPVHFVALDPAADGEDYTGVVLLAREEHQKGEPEDPDFAVEHMLRIKMALRLNQELEYADVLAQMFRLNRYLKGLQSKGASMGTVFCVETNGVGYGYEQALRSKLSRSTPVIGYTTIGVMNDDTAAAKKMVMPRLAGLDNLRIQIETHHLKLERDAPGTRELEGEFRAFVWRGPGRPEAMEGHNDDLVMATAGAVWAATKLVPPALKSNLFTRPKKPYYGTTMRRVH